MSEEGVEDQQRLLNLEEEHLSQPKRQKKIAEYTQMNLPKTSEMRKVSGSPSMDHDEHREDTEEVVILSMEKPRDKEPMSDAQTSKL